MTYTQAHAELAARHVRDGQARVDKLAADIARAKALGHPTKLAEEALTTMHATLRLMIEHQEVIEASRTTHSGD